MGSDAGILMGIHRFFGVQVKNILTNHDIKINVTCFTNKAHDPRGPNAGGSSVNRE